MQFTKLSGEIVYKTQASLLLLLLIPDSDHDFLRITTYPSPLLQDQKDDILDFKENTTKKFLRECHPHERQTEWTPNFQRLTSARNYVNRNYSPKSIQLCLFLNRIFKKTGWKFSPLEKYYKRNFIFGWI